MRAAMLRAYGETPRAGEFEDPRAGEGELVLRVLAGGLNPVDLSIAAGAHFSGRPPLPSVVGREGIGETEDGRRVYFDGAIRPYGAFAQRTLVQESGLWDVPQDIDPGLAICFGIAGLAAWLALDWRAQLREGETVLVLGASGMVGQIAVQGARLLGAGRVVAAARNTDALRHSEQLGADATVTIGASDDLAAAFREACGGDGPDVVVDPLWGEPAAAAIEACARGARVVQLGQSAGLHATLSSATVRGRLLSVLGHNNFGAPAQVKHAAFDAMVAHGQAGRLTAQVERVPLDDVADAWERQRSSPHHKLVLIP